MNKSRRLSFMDGRRKSLVLVQEFMPDSPLRASTTNNEMETISQDQYLNSLKEERLQWHHIRQNIKKELKESKDKGKYTPLTVHEDQVQLSVEDEEFLKQRPDYIGVLKQVEKYMDALSFMTMYQADLKEHYDEVVQRANKKIAVVFDVLTSDKVCEVCNTNCNNSNHAF